MTREQFDALLARRDELARAHDSACLILEEEGSGRDGENYDRCAELHAELTEVEEAIDAEIGVERDREFCPEPASEEPPAT